MRSAGCIINDIIDRDIDKEIYRTKQRPLAAKRISLFEAILLLIVLLAISFLILLQFNYNAIIVGLLSIPFIVLYPFMKRITNWPQIILGIVFSWGVLIVTTQFNNAFNKEFIFLYIGCFFGLWVMILFMPIKIERTISNKELDQLQFFLQKMGVYL